MSAQGHAVVRRNRPWFKRLNLAGVMLVSLTFLAYFLLYLPSIIMGIMSFNDTTVPLFPLSGFTLDWYGSLLTSELIRESFFNSVTIAFITMVLAIAIGTPAAFGLVRGRFKGRNLVFTLMLLPMLTPTLILAIALLLFFNFVGVGLGLPQVIAGHVLFTLPFVVLIISLRLFGFDRTLEQAAADLRANQWQVLRRITLPLIFPGLFAAALFAFLLSWDEVLIAFFNIDNRSTLPIFIWTSLRHRLTMELVSLGTILSLATALIVVIAWFALRKKTVSASQEEVGNA